MKHCFLPAIGEAEFVFRAGGKVPIPPEWRAQIGKGPR
jgi:hypothetical protein